MARTSGRAMGRMALAATMAAAVMVAGLVRGAAGAGGIAVGGYGVLAVAQHQQGSLGDVATITARLLGIDTSLQAGRDTVLPTGDLFSRPKACMILAVEGMDVETAQAPDNLLRILHSPPVVMSLESTTAPMVSQAMSNVGKVLKREFSEAMVVEVSNAGLSLEHQLAAFSAKIAALPHGSTSDEHPDVLLFNVHGFNQSDATSVALLNEFAKHALSEVGALYDGRLASQAVLLGSDAKATGKMAHGRNLQFFPEQSENEFIRTNEIADYLIESWVAVILIIFLLILFLCVPWAGEMDPILYSSLAKEDTKRD